MDYRDLVEGGDWSKENKMTDGDGSDTHYALNLIKHSQRKYMSFFAQELSHYYTAARKMCES